MDCGSAALVEIPAIIGRQITLNNRPNTIIGVLPADFGWHVPKGSMTRKAAEIWSPWEVSNELRRAPGPVRVRSGPIAAGCHTRAGATGNGHDWRETPKTISRV